MKKISFGFLLFSLGIISCAKSNTGTPATTSINQPLSEKPLINLTNGWKNSGIFGTNFPEDVQVFQFDSVFQGNKVKAICVAFDSKDTTIEFKPVLSSVGVVKPSQFSVNESGVVYACINGGFFGGTNSYSLVQNNKKVFSPNVRAVTRLYNGVNTSYYPTRAAFGILENRRPSVAWVYHPDSDDDTVYSYNEPSLNLINSPPLAQPTKQFPAGAKPWNTVSAIGGSPVLIKGSNIVITDAQELINIDNNTNRSRSAIGVTADGIILILAIQGNHGSYTGMNLSDLAVMLKSLGCTDAINLDGGSSTTLVIGGQTAIIDGGASGIETAVKSAIIIKRKQ